MRHFYQNLPRILKHRRMSTWASTKAKISIHLTTVRDLTQPLTCLIMFILLKKTHPDKLFPRSRSKLLQEMKIVLNQPRHNANPTQTITNYWAKIHNCQTLRKMPLLTKWFKGQQLHKTKNLNREVFIKHLKVDLEAIRYDRSKQSCSSIKLI